MRVVELGSFSAAAADLRVGQPTVSKWVAALEEELGVTLVERTTRTRRVTDAGQRFYARAKDLVDGWDAALAEARATSPELRGRLRVSVPVVFGRRHVLPHLPAFLDAHPRVELDLRSSDRYVNLVEERFDLAIRVGAPVDSSFRARTLATTPRRLVAAPGLPTPAHPRELAVHPCLQHRGLSGAVWTLQRGDERVRASVSGRIAADNSEALLALTEAGHGIALLASWLVDDRLAAGALVRVLPGWNAPPAPIRAVFPPSRHRAPAVAAFVEHLGAAFAKAFARSA